MFIWHRDINSDHFLLYFDPRGWWTKEESKPHVGSHGRTACFSITCFYRQLLLLLKMPVMSHNFGQSLNCSHCGSQCAVQSAKLLWQLSILPMAHNVARPDRSSLRSDKHSTASDILQVCKADDILSSVSFPVPLPVWRHSEGIDNIWFEGDLTLHASLILLSIQCSTSCPYNGTCRHGQMIA